MKINIIDIDSSTNLEPLTCKRKLQEVMLAGSNLKDILTKRIESIIGKNAPDLILSVKIDLWPSPSLLSSIMKNPVISQFVYENGDVAAWISPDGKCPDNVKKIKLGPDSKQIKYPWQVLEINEEIVGGISENIIEGEVRYGVTIDGHLIVGKGTVILPGVYIEGNVIIGENCKIGPNCYLRGNTYIADNCHVGQAVEIKNSILMNKVMAGHLNYLGDSIICPFTNFGASTITANFRHDGKNHRSMVNGELIDTGRRKLGSIIGDNVHTGIHTSIYPGRKIWPDMMTLPGDVVKKDLKPENA